MKLRTSVFVIACVSMLSFACSSPTRRPNTNSTSAPPSSAAATPDPFAEARALFAKDCQTCHQPDGTGGRVKLEDGTRLRVPNLREGHALRHPDSEFRKQIIEGGDGMPSFKVKMSSRQVDEMIRFIRQEFQRGITPPPEKSTKQ